MATVLRQQNIMMTKKEASHAAPRSVGERALHHSTLRRSWTTGSYATGTHRVKASLGILPSPNLFGLSAQCLRADWPRSTML